MTRFCRFIDALGLKPTPGQEWVAEIATDSKTLEKRLVVGVLSPGLLKRSSAMRLSVRIAELCKTAAGKMEVETLSDEALPDRLNPKASWLADIIKDEKTGRKRVGVGVLEPGLLRRPDAMALSIKLAELCNAIGAEGD